MTPLNELLARLEAADTGSRELDASIHEVATGYRLARDFWWRASNYTTSVDAGLTLVPDHHRWILDKRPYAATRVDGYRALVYPQGSPDMPESTWAATPALALAIAALRARQAVEEA